MAVMFFKDAGGVDTAHDSSMVADALLQLQTSRGLRAVLFIVGFLLIVYGEFVSRGWVPAALSDRLYNRFPAVIRSFNASTADRRCRASGCLFVARVHAPHMR